MNVDILHKTSHYISTKAFLHFLTGVSPGTNRCYIVLLSSLLLFYLLSLGYLCKRTKPYLFFKRTTVILHLLTFCDFLLVTTEINQTRYP